MSNQLHPQQNDDEDRPGTPVANPNPLNRKRKLSNN